MERKKLNEVGLVRQAGPSIQAPVRGVKSRPHGFPVMLLLFALAAPAAAQASTGGIYLGSGRLLPSVAMVIGLIGVIVGRKALRHTRGVGNGRARAKVAIVFGLLSLLIGALHAANSAGGFGTGNGLAGAIVALLLGSVATVLGVLALQRSLSVRGPLSSESKKRT